MNLKKGDTIGIISQSWCGPEVFPHVLDKGIKNIKKMGFKIKEFPYTRKQGTPKERAEDLTKAILDPDVKAIICSIGGDDCTFLLEYLDIDLLKKHKKPIMGYSDPTALLFYLSQKGFPCYYGPTIMAGFSHMHLYPKWFDYTKNILEGNNNTFFSYDEYNDGYKDWSKNVIELKSKKRNDGFRFLNKLRGEGKLFGGNIEVLEFLKCTKYWPKQEFWKDKILFLENSDDNLSITQIKYILRNYGFSKILSNIQGILFGRARDFSNDKKKELDKLILNILKEFNIKIPVVTNVDFGHTNPQLILKYGDKISISPESIDYIND